MYRRCCCVRGANSGQSPAFGYPVRQDGISTVGKTLRALLHAESGATALEYGLILALISILVVAWATQVGTSVSDFFTSVNNGF